MGVPEAHGFWVLLFASRCIPRPHSLVRPPPRLKNSAPVDDAGTEPRPGHIRKPIGWSMIMIGVLVAVSAAPVYRRDGIDGVGRKRAGGHQLCYNITFFDEFFQSPPPRT
jgi:hypothetical protein